MNFAVGKAEAIASALQSQAEAPDIKTIILEKAVENRIHI
jgi:hypothetical protein